MFRVECIFPYAKTNTEVLVQIQNGSKIKKKNAMEFGEMNERIQIEWYEYDFPLSLCSLCRTLMKKKQK